MESNAQVSALSSASESSNMSNVEEVDGMEDYERRWRPNVKRHLRLAKWVGIILIALATGVSIPPLAMSNTPTQPKWSEKNISDIACAYVKRYNLTLNTYITVCNMNGDIMLDIQRNTAISMKITLTVGQWLSLKNVISGVDSAISEARTYWKDLNSA